MNHKDRAYSSSPEEAYYDNCKEKYTREKKNEKKGVKKEAGLDSVSKNLPKDLNRGER